MKRTVYVYRHEVGEYRNGQYVKTGRAYSLAYFTYQTRGACIHEVEADGLTRAKIHAAAMREHREKCGDKVTNGE